MRRQLSSLTSEELNLLERTANATHIPAWKLVALVLDDVSYVFEPHEVRTLDEFIERLHLGARAREVFDRVMSAPGLHISTPKKHSTNTEGAKHLPRSTEPGTDKTAGYGRDGGPGDQSAHKEQSHG